MLCCVSTIIFKQGATLCEASSEGFHESVYDLGFPRHFEFNQKHPNKEMILSISFRKG